MKVSNWKKKIDEVSEEEEDGKHSKFFKKDGIHLVKSQLDLTPRLSTW